MDIIMKSLIAIIYSSAKFLLRKVNTEYLGICTVLVDNRYGNKIFEFYVNLFKHFKTVALHNATSDGLKV